MQDFVHEASKPVARHAGDKDLEHSLKQVERAGDPMLQYMREKKRERGQLPPGKIKFFLNTILQLRHMAQKRLL